MNPEQPNISNKKEGIDKIEQRAKEIKENITPNGLSSVLNDLDWYLSYRSLYEGSKKDPSLMNDAIEKITENQDLFDVLNEKYGWSPEERETKWSIKEIEELIKELQK